MSTYFITGTSRGIGLELAIQLLQQPLSQVSKVIAVTRSSPTPALATLISTHSDRVINLIIKDLTDEDLVQQALTELQQKHGIEAIDVLVNNAGIMPYHPEGIKTMTAKDLREVLDTNVVSVQVLTTALIPLLEKGNEKKVMNISSMFGSLALAKHFHHAPAQGYKVSKTALTMLTLQWALEYQSREFTFLCISPGWLRTDLGSQYADLSVLEGVAAVLDIILHHSDPSQTGKHLNIKVEGWGPEAEGVKEEGRNVYDGGDMPW